MIPVQERQNLILAVAAQSRAALWDIQATAVGCSHTAPAWQSKQSVGQLALS